MPEAINDIMPEAINDIKDLHPVILILVLSGLFLGVGLIILGDLVDLSVEQVGPVNTAANESWATASNSTNKSLTNQYLISVSNVTNSSNGAPVSSTNYTVYLKQGKIILNTGNPDLYFEDYDLNVSYSYNEQGAESTQAVNTTIGEIGDFSGWFGILVIVIMASIILGIVLTNFGKARVR